MQSSSSSLFQSRQRRAPQLSNNPRTRTTRGYEYSLVGLDAALHKINNNRRQVKSRETKKLQESVAWVKWTESERQECLNLALNEINEKFDQQKRDAKRQWAENNELNANGNFETNSDWDKKIAEDSQNREIPEETRTLKDRKPFVQMCEDESEESQVEVSSNGMETEFETDFDDAEDEDEEDNEFGVRDHEGNRIITEEVLMSFRGIWDRARERVNQVVKNAEKYGRCDEEPFLDL